MKTRVPIHSASLANPARRIGSSVRMMRKAKNWIAMPPPTQITAPKMCTQRANSYHVTIRRL